MVNGNIYCVDAFKVGYEISYQEKSMRRPCTSSLLLVDCYNVGLLDTSTPI